MISPEALAEEIESGGTTTDRRKKIETLGKLADSNATRLLLNLYNRSMWRETRIDIIRALSFCNNDRSLEFLIKTARDQSDLQIAGEAILAIGQTASALGGEVLLSFLDDVSHPLAKEAVIGLSNMRVFPCEDSFEKLLTSGIKLGPTITQFLIIGLGRKARGGAWSIIEEYLDPDSQPAQIFNAALIAAGKLGRSEALKKLQQVDTRYRFFANQLKLASIEQIHYRLSSSFEDIYSMILSGSDPSSSLSTLRQYPHEDAWEAFTILGEEASAETSAIVRLALSDTNRAVADLLFVNNNEDISSPVRAALYRQYLSLAENDSLVAFKNSSQGLEICLSLHHPAIFEWLLDDKNESAHSVAGINALVAQCQMRPNLTERVGQNLIKRVATYDNQLRARAIRALGQIKFDHPSTYTCLQQNLKSADFSSVITAYGMLGSEEAQAALSKQIKQLPPESIDTDKLKLLTAKLAGFHVNKPEVLQKFLQIPEILDDLLKILGHSVLSEPPVWALIERALASDNHQTRMLAIAAAKRNFNQRIIDLLFEQFKSETDSYKFRALDTLCFLQDGDAHLRLIKGLEGASIDEIEKVIRCLDPVPEFDYTPAINILTQVVTVRPDLAGNSEVSSGIINLIENLNLKSDVETIAKSDSSHDVDPSLSVLIPFFNRLSNGSKAALRNAELTHGQDVLFNDLVDKSTVLIEHVKCIDLQFQEKIGTKMFLGAGRLVDEMRQRILQLGLDEDNQTQGVLIEALQCSKQFPAADFPSHKLFTICKAFLSGKIAREQYKVIDGLRAWGLVLLLFGRTFNFRGQQITPILNVYESSNPVIATLAFDLNHLQELRNLAAHRGTLVSRSQVDDLRKASIDCLNRTLHVIG